MAPSRAIISQYSIGNPGVALIHNGRFIVREFATHALADRFILWHNARVDAYEARRGDVTAAVTARSPRRSRANRSKAK